MPAGFQRVETVVPPLDDARRAMRASVYVPRERPPMGALLLVPGLHHAGPDDPRMDRFAAILAHAGLLVLAPFLPDFTRLRVAPGALADTERAFDALWRSPLRPRGLRPGVFSVSFGSLPALRLAASERSADRVGGLVVFGGYADWGETLRFCLDGAPGRPHDPLNEPVVFMNLLRHMEGLPDDTAPVVAAWRRTVERTWGRPEMKARARYEPVAEAEARGLDPAQRALFLMGCGLRPGGRERCARALERAGSAFDWVDPRPHMGGLRCPVHVVHGRADDVIPCEQAAQLAAAIPAGAAQHTWLTGMYAHTGKMGLRELGALAPAAASELLAMRGILRAIVEVATRRGTSRSCNDAGFSPRQRTNGRGRTP